MGISRSEYEDVRQDTAVRIALIDSRKELDISRPKAFIASVARNVIRERRRLSKRISELIESDSLADMASGTEVDEFVSEDLSIYLRSTLTTDEIDLVDLLLQDKSLQEMAAELSVSPAAVAQRKCRLKAKLEALLLSQP